MSTSITTEQFMVVTILPMITGSLSVIGSTTIIFIVLRSNERLSSTYHRILFGMSSMDIIYSTGILMSSLPVPREIPLPWGNYGNRTTCTIQGSMIFSGNIGSNMYNLSLALFYMLTIVIGVRDETMKGKIEPFFHTVPLLYIISVNTILLITKSFNPSVLLCMITPYPRDCKLNPNVPCTRGVNAPRYFYVFHGYPVLTIFFLVLILMATLYHAVRSQEKKIQRSFERKQDDFCFKSFLF